jgi:uncharacterized membrane protein
MKDNVNQAMTAAVAFGVGMLMMYVFDPDQGRRRRALAVDKVRSASAGMSDITQAARRDAVNRGRGLIARMRSRLFMRHASAQTLEEQVRARISRAVSNAGALEVRADDGAVVLAGPLLKRELNKLMSAAWSTPGVERIDNQLELHDQPGDIPALQGARKQGVQSRLMGESWTPSLRVLAGVTGAAATIAGLVYRPFGIAGTLLGGALLVRAIGNKSLRRMAGLSGPESVHIDKEIFIAAPPKRVFEFWRRQENFPHFMRNVLDVRPAGENCWRWRVAGPLGGAVEWYAEIVEHEENRRLAWRTLPGSSVEHQGRIDFESDAGGTRLRVSMGYAPTGGVLGHAVARLFGKDAKTEIDEDLMRTKSFLETGIPPHDAARAGEPVYGEAQRSAP